MATKSNLISGMGVALSLVQALVAAVRELAGDEADDKIHELVTEHGKSKLSEIARIVAGKTKEILLRKVASAAVSANKKFVLADVVKRANVGYMSPQFQKLFGDKVEENVPCASVAAHKLEKGSRDTAIITELGGSPEMALAYLFERIEVQKNGEEGFLLTNGYANIVYAIGNDGNIWAVSAGWSSVNRFWNVYAYSVGNPYPWDAGYQILSRDS